MKTIKIKSIQLTNFKGIRRLSISSFGDQAFIYGENGIGKTTLFDAFTWLLFGKDSTDRKDFEIKTLDQNNNVIPKIDHEVEATILVDDETVELKRIFREKWVTRRGSSESEFVGNETIYEWNGVPMNAGEYSAKIGALVDEKVFKLITSPLAFNSLKWQDQRDVLIDMAGEVSDQQIAAGNPDYEQLVSNLTNKSLDEYKKQIKASISKSKKELQTIPTRIDEVERGKPDSLNFDNLESELKKNEQELASIDEKITDELKAQQALIDTKKKIRSQIHELEYKIDGIKHEYRSKAKEQYRNQNSGSDDLKRKLQEKNQELTTAANAMGTLEAKLKAKKTELTQLSEKIVSKRAEWHEVNEKPVNPEVETNCPTCHQELPETDIEAKKEEIKAQINAKREEKLNQLNNEGRSLKVLLDAVTKERDDLKERIEKGFKIVGDLGAQANQLEHELKGSPITKTKSEDEIYAELLEEDVDIKMFQKEANDLNQQYENVGDVNVDGFKKTRDEISKEISGIKLVLGRKLHIQHADKRIEELSVEEKTLAQAIADLEKDYFIIESFEKAKADQIEESVNKRFELVTFKLFESQINGGEIPTCKALINGVPFSDANTASKINAGIDIINTLSKHYGATAPIFIDNRESVVDLIDTDSQVVNLIVSEDDKTLRISDTPMTYSQFKFNEKLQEV